MKILTFDIEDWFHCDFISDNATWGNYNTRIFESTEKILSFLDEKKITATFFILGWIAEKYPEIVKTIQSNGHEIASHSYLHNLTYKLTPKEFTKDTEKSIKLLEDIIGEKIIIYRAPGFSITEKTPWAFEILAKFGIEIDCSVFPAKHDYGGFPNFGESQPAIILYNGISIKEFPINTKKILLKNIVFSGGGFFRLFPYKIISNWTSKSSYLMSYFHPRDFDYNQPVLNHLPLIRKFKSYYGLKDAFKKFENWVEDFETISLIQAEEKIDWESAKIIKL